MKKFTLCLFVLVLALGVSVMAADNAINGWVTDAKCGVKGAHEGGEACAKKCIAAGEKMVFVTDGDQKVLTVANPDVLKDHIGHHVAVTGKVDNDSVHVDSVKMLASSDKAKPGL
jgi:hypothetical protein